MQQILCGVALWRLFHICCISPKRLFFEVPKSEFMFPDTFEGWPNALLSGHIPARSV